MAGQAIVTIRDKQWQVSLADAPWELAQGLGGLPELAPGTGMLFDTGWTQIIQVTTASMLFPIDIAFLSETMVITEVYHNVEPGYIVTSTLPARYFLEVNAGELEGIDSGDRASVVFLPLEGIPMMATDWTSTMVSFMAFMVMAVFMTAVVKGFITDALQPPKEKPLIYGPRGERLLAQTDDKRRAIKVIDARGMTLAEVYNIHRQYPPNLFRGMGVQYSHLTTEKDIKEFKKRAVEAGAVVVIIQEYGQTAYVPVVRQPTARPDIWETRAVVLEDTLTDMPGFQDKLSQLEDWLTNVEREVFPTRELVRRTVERFPDRFGITKDNVVFVQFAHFPSTARNKPARDEVEIGTWVERDRIGIWLTDKRTGKTVAEWWDEDAREMFEQGWFKPGDIRYQTITGRAFEESVLDYAESMGILTGSSKHLPQTTRMDAYYWTAVNKDTGEIVESFTPYTSSGRALRGGRAHVSRHWRGDKALVEVWRQPYRYSENLRIEPVASEVVVEADDTFKPGAIVLYRGERVRVSEQIGDRVNIFIPSRQELVWVKPEALERIGSEEAAVIPTEPRRPRPRREDELEFLPDSPEFLAYTIDDIGYRQKIDTAFQQAIRRAKGLK